MTVEVERGADGPVWPAPFTGAILIWPFDDAPPELQWLSEHGGDEDWLAYVPAAMCGPLARFDEGNLPQWVGGLGCCSVDCHHLADGALVYIGAHA